MPQNSLFGTSGIRGSAAELFTDQFSFDIGRAFAKFLSSKKIVGSVSVGNDSRESGPKIKKALISGLIFENFPVIDEGVVPIPAMCYVLHTDPTICASIMVTGSHIKAELNGVKFFTFKEEISKTQESEIEKFYQEVKEKEDYKENTRSVLHSNRAKDEYIELLRSIMSNSYPNWKVVVDAGGGAQSDSVPGVLVEKGINVVEQNCTIQGDFLARDTENEVDFKELSSRVVSEKADFGIGFDADGDRVIFVDELGVFIPGEYTASIIAKESPAQNVVTTIGASQVVESIGKNVIRTKVGSPYVIEAMKANNAKFGFEANGGGISSEIMMTRDGGTTCIKLLNILAKNSGTLSSLIPTLPKFYLEKTKIDYTWELKDKILEKAKAEFSGIKTEELDGLKIWTNDKSWILFRSSQNAPEFRVFAESDNVKTSKELLEKGISLVREVISNG